MEEEKRANLSVGVSSVGNCGKTKSEPGYRRGKRAGRLVQDKKGQVNGTRLEGRTSETRVRQIEREFCEGVRGLGRGQKARDLGQRFNGSRGRKCKRENVNQLSE